MLRPTPIRIRASHALRAACFLALLGLAACGGQGFGGNGYCPPNSMIDSTGNCVSKPPRGY
jgi:hypothetical protein